MALLNKEALNDINEDLGGDSIFFYQKNIPANGSVDIKLGPLDDEWGGKFYAKIRKIWMGKQSFIEPTSIGLPDNGLLGLVDWLFGVAAGDPANNIPPNPGLAAMLADEKNYQDNVEFWVKVMVMQKTMEGGAPRVTSIKDNGFKIFVPGKQLLKSLSGKVYSDFGLDPLFQKDGSLLFCSKQIGAQTHYQADFWPQPSGYVIPQHLWDDNINMYEIAKEEVMPYAYIKAWVEHKFFGKPEPERPKRENKKATSSIANMPVYTPPPPPPAQPNIPQNVQQVVPVSIPPIQPEIVYQQQVQQLAPEQVQQTQQVAPVASPAAPPPPPPPPATSPTAPPPPPPPANVQQQPPTPPEQQGERNIADVLGITKQPGT